jgi:hypothetical protein
VDVHLVGWERSSDPTIFPASSSSYSSKMSPIGLDPLGVAFGALRTSNANRWKPGCSVRLML